MYVRLLGLRAKMRASCWTRLCPAPAVSHQAFLEEASKSHFGWGDLLASLTSEVLDGVIPFAQMLEAQGVTTLTTR